MFINTSKPIHKSVLIYRQAKKIFSLSELLIFILLPLIYKPYRPPARRTNRPEHKRQTNYPRPKGRLP